MSVTIDTLEIMIGTESSGAASNIEALATALGRLRDNSSLTKVTNNLTKLSDALGRLKMNSSGLSALDNIATAVSSLSAISKPTGLTSALNSLKKIPDLLSGLNDTVLDTFAARMLKLSTALAPLATQIDKVASSFSKLPSQVSKTVTATNKMASASQKAASAQKAHNSALSSGSMKMSSFLINAQSMIYWAQRIADALANVIADAIEWDGIQYRFGRAFGEDAEEAYAYIQKLNEALDINIQQFMQYSSLYGSLLKGFGIADQDKVSTMSIGLTELSYDIWAAYNDQYKTLEDAATAVRSAITGELEPIRRAGIPLSENSLQNYLTEIGMADVKMRDLTEAQKAEVRYAAMVDAALSAGIVGTYARETQTAEGAVRTLTQQLKTLGQAFGSLFIPILQAVIPWVSAFVELLYDAVAAVASFFGITLFKIDWGGSGAGGIADGIGGIADAADDATGSLGDAAGAAKKLKDYTMGFDELNLISPDTGGSGGGGGGGGGGSGGSSGATDWEGIDLETLWDDSVLAQAQGKVDEIKQKILGFFEEWKTEIAIIAGALAALGIANLLQNLGQAVGLGSLFYNTMGLIKKLAATAIVITIQYSLMTELFDSYINEKEFQDYVLALFVGALSTWVLYSMWGTTGIIIGLGVTAAASLKAVLDNGGITDVESMTVAITGFASALGAVAIAVGKIGKALAGTNFAAFISFLREGCGLGPSLSAWFPKLAVVVGKLAGAFSTLWGWISSAASAVGSLIGGLGGGTIALILVAIAGAVVWLVENWNELVAACKKFFKQNIAPKLENIKKSWDNIKDSLSECWEKIKEAFPGFVEWVEKIWGKVKDFWAWIKQIDLSSVWTAIKIVLEGIGAAIIVPTITLIMGLFEAVVGFFEGVVRTIEGAVEIVTGVIEVIVGLFSGEDITDSCQKIVDGIADVFGGIWDACTKPIIDFVDGVIDFFMDLWDELVGHSIVPDTIDGIVECFLSLPDLVLSEVEEFVGDIIEKFTSFGSDIVEKVKDGWEDVKGWWRDKDDLSIPEVGVQLVKDGWTTVKDWIGNIPIVKQGVGLLKSGWATVKGWIGEIPTLSQTIQLIKSGWTTIKAWIGDIPVVKQGVELVKDGWKTVKAWIGKIPTLDQAIQLIKSGWSTIKGWIGSIPKLNQAIGLVKSGWSSVKNWVGSIPKLNQAIGLVKSGWKSIKGWIGSVPTLSVGLKLFKSGWTSIKSWLGNLTYTLSFKLPKIGINWGKKTVLGFTISYPSSFYTYAKGGFPDLGQMFIAREAGPELVGNIGSKSAVVNNDQIVDSVAQGVYSAVVSAMTRVQTGNNGTQAVNVYLDGKQIYSSVKKTEAERGMSLMGNQLGYAY